MSSSQPFGIDIFYHRPSIIIIIIIIIVYHHYHHHCLPSLSSSSLLLSLSWISEVHGLRDQLEKSAGNNAGLQVVITIIIVCTIIPL